MATWVLTDRAALLTLSPVAVAQTRTDRAVLLTLSETGTAANVNADRSVLLTLSPATVLIIDAILGNIPYRTVTVPIRRLRQTPHLSTEQAWLFISSLQLDLETGVGTANGDGQTPYVALQVSKDHGHTWGPELPVEIGPQGARRWRVIWRRLGRAREWTFRFVTDAPVPITLLDAYANPTKGES